MIQVPNLFIGTQKKPFEQLEDYHRLLRINRGLRSETRPLFIIVPSEVVKRGIVAGRVGHAADPSF